MRPLLSPRQMAAADDAAIAAGTPATVLMERAGRAVARTAVALVGGRYGRRIAVVCGRGNNGGDGFVAARALARAGAGVRVLTVGDVDASKGAAGENLRRLREVGLSASELEARDLEDVDAIVDAIFGTGFRGAAEGDAAKAIDAINDAPAPVIAVDIPSGIDGATGGVTGPAVDAAVTIVMQAEKLGTALAPGAARAGRVEIVDIGISVPDADCFMTEAIDVVRVLPRRAPDAHKRSGGAVVVLGGSAGMSGAPALVARGAARAGAGYVTVGTTARVDDALSALLPETLSRVVTDGDVLGPESIDGLGDALERAYALALGPGLGRGEEQTALVARALGDLDIPIALDADGLNALAGDTRPLADRDAPTVATPHPAELGRLLDVSVGEIQSDRLELCRRAARELGCVVLLKGYRSVIAQPSGDAVVNPTGGPELATAGTGDVLTGVVAALLAAGVEPFDAAWAGAFVHGDAGRIAAAAWGSSGVLAWDIAETIADAVAGLEPAR